MYFRIYIIIIEKLVNINIYQKLEKLIIVPPNTIKEKNIIKILNHNVAITVVIEFSLNLENEPFWKIFFLLIYLKYLIFYYLTH